MQGEDIPNRQHSFYSVEYGVISQKRIFGLYRSKLKAEPFLERDIDDKVRRGLRFSKEVIDSLRLLYYEVPNTIEFVTDETDVTHNGKKERFEGGATAPTEKGVTELHEGITGSNSKNIDNKPTYTTLKPVTTVTTRTPGSVTSVTSVTESDLEEVKRGLKKRAERLGLTWTDPDDIHITEPKKFVCRNCDLCFSDNMEYDKHTIFEHPRRAGYPVRETTEA